MNYILNRRSIRRTFLTENRLLVAFGVRIPIPGGIQTTQTARRSWEIAFAVYVLRCENNKRGHYTSRTSNKLSYGVGDFKGVGHCEAKF